MKFLVLFACFIAACSAGLLPAAVPAVPAAFAAPAALTVGTYASSYNAHAVNHAFAAPYVAASPLIAHAAAAPFAYSAYPAAVAHAPAAYFAGRR